MKIAQKINPHTFPHGINPAESEEAYTHSSRRQDRGGFWGGVGVKEETILPGFKLLSVKAPVSGAVTVLGSFLGGRFYDSRKASPILTLRMLDWGTKKKSKDEIREKLESLGASLEFSADERRVRFKIKCLKKNLPAVVSILAEEIKEPALKNSFLKIEKNILITDYKISKEDTDDVARRELRKNIFPENHPLYLPSADESIKKVSNTHISDVKTFHKNFYGLGNMIVASSGDMDHSELARIFKKEFSGFKESPLKFLPPKDKINEILKPIEKNIFIPEKTSVSFKIGQALLIDKDHPDFYPLLLGVWILGKGSFTGRLMKKVREEKGLSYGVYAELSGGTKPDNAYFSVSATFAPKLLSMGKKVVMSEIEKWIKTGVTAEELKIVKEIIIGSFKVGLGTTTGLASVLISNAENGRAPEYLDRYPEIIKSVTLSEVNKAIKKHISSKSFVSVMAGSVKK